MCAGLSFPTLSSCRVSVDFWSSVHPTAVVTYTLVVSAPSHVSDCLSFVDRTNMESDLNSDLSYSSVTIGETKSPWDTLQDTPTVAKQSFNMPLPPAPSLTLQVKRVRLQNADSAFVHHNEGKKLRLDLPSSSSEVKKVKRVRMKNCHEAVEESTAKDTAVHPNPSVNARNPSNLPTNPFPLKPPSLPMNTAVVSKSLPQPSVKDAMLLVDHELLIQQSLNSSVANGLGRTDTPNTHVVKTTPLPAVTIPVMGTTFLPILADQQLLLCPVSSSHEAHQMNLPLVVQAAETLHDKQFPNSSAIKTFKIPKRRLQNSTLSSSPPHTSPPHTSPPHTSPPHISAVCMLKSPPSPRHSFTQSSSISHTVSPIHDHIHTLSPTSPPHTLTPSDEAVSQSVCLKRVQMGVSSNPHSLSFSLTTSDGQSWTSNNLEGKINPILMSIL